MTSNHGLWGVLIGGVVITSLLYLVLAKSSDTAQVLGTAGRAAQTLGKAARGQ